MSCGMILSGGDLFCCQTNLGLPWFLFGRLRQHLADTTQVEKVKDCQQLVIGRLLRPYPIFLT